MKIQTTKIALFVVLSLALLLNFARLAEWKTRYNEAMQRDSLMEQEIEYAVQKAVFQTRREVRDSLLRVFHQRKPVVEVVTEIDIKYEKSIDSIIGLPVDDRIRFIAGYLDTYGTPVK
jgi:hypothetical protein